MPHIAQLKDVRIRMSNDEIIVGNIVDQTETEFIVQVKAGGIIRVMRGAVVYIEETSAAQ